MLVEFHIDRCRCGNDKLQGIKLPFWGGKWWRNEQLLDVITVDVISIILKLKH